MAPTRPALAALAGVVLVASAGCGSSGNGWHAFAKRTVDGSAVGAAGGTVENPAAVQVKVEADPDVKTQVNYSIDCSGGLHPQTGLANGRTPFTTPVPLPGGRQPCTVSASASKSQPTKMTVTLLAREVPST